MLAWNLIKRNTKLYTPGAYRLTINMERKAAGFIVFRTKNKEVEFLILQASYGDHHWSPPKGHVDPGETDLETAYRETKEEAGFDKDDLQVDESFKQFLKYPVNNDMKTVTYWFAELLTEKQVILSSEHTDYKWSNFTEACKLTKHKTYKDLFEKCLKFCKKK